MNLKTAVFTAEHGYKWTTPPAGITESQLSRYGKTVDQAYREGMGPSDYIQGVIYDGSLVAVFSALRTGPGWDTAGRAAKYYALAFIERELWPQINFDELLKDPFFLKPDKNPPAEIGYSGAVSSKVDESVLALFSNGGRGPERIDFSCLGNFLSVHFQLGLNWRFYRSNLQGWHGPELTFEKSLMFGSFTHRTPNAVTEAAPVVNNAERKDAAMVLNDASSDLPSSDVAKIAYTVKRMRQDVDVNRGQIQATTQKIKLLTIAVFVLVALNVCLVLLSLFSSGLMSRLQSHDDNEDSLPKLEEKLNKRKMKNASIAYSPSTNVSASSGKAFSVKDSHEKHDNKGSVK